jgi:hypothetical protein
MKRLSCRIALFVCALLFLPVAGCTFKYEDTVSLDQNDVKSRKVDGPSKDQDVTVTLSSPGVPIDAYLVLEEDRKKLESLLTGGAKPKEKDGVLAAKEKAEEITLTARIPAKKAYAIILAGAQKKTDVKLKITGK